MRGTKVLESYAPTLALSELQKKQPITSEKVRDWLYNISKSQFTCVAYEDGTFAIDKEHIENAAQWLKIGADVAELAGRSNWNYVQAKLRDLRDEVERANILADTEKQSSKNRAGSKEHTGKVGELISIINDAAQQGGSDIHISIRNDDALIYWRVDGIVDVTPIRRKRNDAIDMIAAAINHAGDDHSSDDFNPNIDISGKIDDVTVTIDGKTRYISVRLHFRSLTPGEDGDKVCIIRLLNTGKAKQLDELDLNQKVKQTLRATMQASNGMVLVTGPTGSGKSTTLHAMLGAKPKEAIVHTIEDPIETVSDDPLVFQGKKKEGKDETKELMRCDLDIGMAGECRDVVTAKDAFSMARTGHLMLATLHSNSSISAIARLADMGVSYDEMAEVNLLRMIMAQRLVPLTCSKCAMRVTASRNGKYKDYWARWESIAAPDVVERLDKLASSNKLKIRNANGCPECNHRGIRGRKLVMEYTIVDNLARRFIREGDLESWQASLEERGWQSMQAHGWELISSGLADPDIVDSKIQDTIFDTSKPWEY